MPTHHDIRHMTGGEQSRAVSAAAEAQSMIGRLDMFASEVKYAAADQIKVGQSNRPARDSEGDMAMMDAAWWFDDQIPRTLHALQMSAPRIKGYDARQIVTAFARIRDEYVIYAMDSCAWIDYAGMLEAANGLLEMAKCEFEELLELSGAICRYEHDGTLPGEVAYAAY